MLSKCANPACSARFRYFHEGKLFRVEGRRGDSADSGAVWERRLQRIEFFWLCEACATEMTVMFHPETGITVTPLVRTLRTAS